MNKPVSHEKQKIEISHTFYLKDTDLRTRIGERSLYYPIFIDSKIICKLYVNMSRRSAPIFINSDTDDSDSDIDIDALEREVKRSPAPPPLPPPVRRTVGFNPDHPVVVNKIVKESDLINSISERVEEIRNKYEKKRRELSKQEEEEISSFYRETKLSIHRVGDNAAPDASPCVIT